MASSYLQPVEQLFKVLLDNGGSEVRLRAGAAPMLKIGGSLRPLKTRPVTAEEVQALAAAVLPAGGDKSGFSFAASLGLCRGAVLDVEGTLVLVLRPPAPTDQRGLTANKSTEARRGELNPGRGTPPKPKAVEIDGHSATEQQLNGSEEVGTGVVLVVLVVLIGVSVTPVFYGPWHWPLLHNICRWGGIIAGVLFAWMAVALAIDLAHGKAETRSSNDIEMWGTWFLLLVSLAMAMYPIRYWNSHAELASPSLSVRADDLSRPAAGTWAGLLRLSVNPTPETFRRFVEYEIGRISEIAPVLRTNGAYRLDLRKSDSVVSPYEGWVFVECFSEHGDGDVGITFSYTIECRYGLIDGTWTSQTLSVTPSQPVAFSRRIAEPVNFATARRASARADAISKLTKGGQANNFSCQSIDELGRFDWGASYAELLLGINR